MTDRQIFIRELEDYAILNNMTEMQIASTLTNGNVMDLLSEVFYQLDEKNGTIFIDFEYNDWGEKYNHFRSNVSRETLIK